MTWLAVAHPGDDGAGPAALSGVSAALLPQGSIYVEADLGRWTQDDQTVFVLHRRDGGISHASLHIGADGAIVYARRLNDRRQQVALATQKTALEGPIRITLSWNLPMRSGLLSVEVASEGTLAQRDFADPLPWTPEDVAHLKRPAGTLAFGPILRCFGLSDTLEPVGIAPSLTTGAPVLTPTGFRPVETLRPDDAVYCQDGTVRPVLWSGRRVVPATGRFRPIRLLSPYLGLRGDVVVAPEQRLLITGPEVEYLFGEEAVLVEAHSLLHSNYAVYEEAGPTICYHQLVLADHAILNVAGAPMESLFVGDLRDTPEIQATTVLHDVAAERLPRHDALAYPALRGYEAVTLRAALVSR